MQSHRPSSLFKNVRKRLLENDALRFLFFVERVPKHRVMESINIVFLSFLSIGCFLAGLAGFSVLEFYGFMGFMLYYLGVLVAVLELLHCLLDR